MTPTPVLSDKLKRTLEEVLLRHYQQGATDNILGIMEGVLQSAGEATLDELISEMVQVYWKSVKLPLNYVYKQSHKDEWLLWLRDFFSIILKYPWENLLNKVQEKGVKKDLAVMVMGDYDLFRGS
jgi:hypothetical protein